MSIFPLVSIVYQKRDDTFRAMSLLELAIVGTITVFTVAYGMALAGVPEFIAAAVRGVILVSLIALYFRLGVFYKEK